MGILLSKFRKEKSTLQILEGLEQKIKENEAFTASTQAQQKRLIGNFLVISIGLYVIAFIVFYFLFFPPTWNERIVYSTPMLLFPILIFMVKRMFAWYFQRKVDKKSTQLQTLRAEKKKILEKVAEKETYNVALEILKKYSEKPAQPRPMETRMVQATPNRQPPMQMGTPQQPQLRQRIINSPNQAAQLRTPVQHRSPAALQQQQQQHQQHQQMNSPQPQHGTPTRRTPFPVIDHRDKGVLEKMVDYLIGDGPSNRFGMICKHCFGHNGMVMQEEYEYASFRCCHCQTLNPARKQRPVAPRLEVTPERLLQRQPSSSSTSEEEKNSGTDEDTEPIKVEDIHPEETTKETEKPDVEEATPTVDLKKDDD